MEERKIVGVHLHHDNVILQEKVNSLRQLVDEMTKSNHNLIAQLKQHKRHKAKPTEQEAKASKDDPP